MVQGAAGTAEGATRGDMAVLLSSVSIGFQVRIVGEREAHPVPITTLHCVRPPSTVYHVTGFT